MTVTCLNQLQKDNIVGLYNGKHLNQKELAKKFKTSPRTINRVLIEADVATPGARIKGDAHTAMQLLKMYGIPVANLSHILYTHKMRDSASFVEDYLLHASEEELGRLFWMANKHAIKKEMMLDAKFIYAA